MAVVAGVGDPGRTGRGNTRAGGLTDTGYNWPFRARQSSGPPSRIPLAYEYFAMSNPEQMIAFWLVPARREKEFFASVIRELALRFDAPVFEPHVTLQGGAIDPAKALAALENVAAQTGSFDLEVAHLNFAEAYTKTVFVQFRASTEAAALSEALRQSAGTHSYEFDPHLSLLYKEMPVREKQEVAESIALPFERVQFDAVKVISCPVAISRREDVEAWQVLGEKRLSDP